MYFKTFYAAVIAAFTSRLLTSLVALNIKMTTIWNVALPSPSFAIPELIAFIIFGVIMGFVGIAYSYAIERVFLIRNLFGGYYFGFFTSKRMAKYSIFKIFENRMIWVVVMTVITSVLTFPDLVGKYMSLANGGTLEDLMSSKALSETDGWNSGGPTTVFVNLAIFVSIRIIISIFSSMLPVPGGFYIPMLIIGAGIGRFTGEVMAVIFPQGFTTGLPIYPGAYALVGAVSFSAASTQAFSTVFIFLEVAGLSVYMPSLLSALISVRISRWLYSSVYDLMIKVKGWSVVLENLSNSDDMKVSTLMHPFDALEILEETTSIYEIGQILKKPTIPKILPVVNNRTELILLGQVSTKSLEQQYKMRQSRLKEKVEKEIRSSTMSLDSMNSKVSETYQQAETQDEVNQAQQTFHTFHHEEELIITQEQEREKSERFTLDYDSCEITVAEDQSAQTAHMLFSKMLLEELFVVWKGRLIGQLHKQMLIKATVSRDRKKINMIL